MENGIVAPGVYSSYCNSIIHFINWLFVEDIDVALPLLTPLGHQTVCATRHARDGESKRAHRKRVKMLFMQRLRDARTAPLIVEANVNAEVAMAYIATGANQRTGKALSESSYRGMKSAINHLFRCQNGLGTPSEYQQRIHNFWAGFGRVTNRRHPNQASVNAVVPDAPDEGAAMPGSDYSSDDNDDDRDELKEGKEPMSVELYRKVLRWLVEYGTRDSLRAACFICLTWNLACRGNNTARLKLSHMSWTKFDAMQINFKHTKTDVTGKQKRAKRNLYPNVHEPDIDFTFLLGLYLSCCFTTSQEVGHRLFSGSSEGTAKRVSRKLREVLELHRDEVIAMGYSDISDIGLHSLRKGAASYLGSLPGGPSPVAICHRCGWSTGKVLDIYFRQLQRGDEFVGRCLSLLNLMSSDFASSPAYFQSKLVDEVWMLNSIRRVFPCFFHIDSMQKILQQCLASMMHHRHYVAQLEVNHPARASIAIFRDHSRMEAGLAALRVDKAWETTNHISGVPPHVKELVDLAEIKDQLGTVVDRIFEKVMQGTKEYFESRRIGGGEITEARLSELIQNACIATQTEVSLRLTQQLERLMTSFQPNLFRESNSNASESRVEIPSELPSDFEYPSSTHLDLWTQWNLPNLERRIPALKTLTPDKYKFLNVQPRSVGECNRLTRLQASRSETRRDSRRTVSDMKVLCEFTEKEAERLEFTTITEDNFIEALQAVTRDWEASTGPLTQGSKKKKFNVQSWKTTLAFVRDLKKDRQNAVNTSVDNGTAANNGERLTFNDDSVGVGGDAAANLSDSNHTAIENDAATSSSESNISQNINRSGGRRQSRIANATIDRHTTAGASEAGHNVTISMRRSRRARNSGSSGNEGSTTDRSSYNIQRRPQRRQRTQAAIHNAPQDVDLSVHFPNAFDNLTEEQIQQLHHVDPQEVARIRREEQQAADQDLLDSRGMVIRHPQGIAQNHGQGSVMERQQYAAVLETLLQDNSTPSPSPQYRMGRNGRSIGRCSINGCIHTFEVFTCHLASCNNYVHHLCADEQQLASIHDERYKYCCVEHQQLGDG
jgi:hypothetical protein